jgi:hypothetical protein
VNLSFIYQIDKLSLEFIEGLNLIYLQLLVFISSFIYIVRVNKIFTKVVNYLYSRFERVSSIRLILSI